MLLWALWFASSLYTWLQWGWRAINSGGGWRPIFGDAVWNRTDFEMTDEPFKSAKESTKESTRESTKESAKESIKTTDD